MGLGIWLGHRYLCGCVFGVERTCHPWIYRGHHSASVAYHRIGRHGCACGVVPARESSSRRVALRNWLAPDRDFFRLRLRRPGFGLGHLARLAHLGRLFAHHSRAAHPPNTQTATRNTS